MEKWISVKDRLPSKEGTYLVIYSGNINKSDRFMKVVEFAQEVFDRIVASEEIIDRDFSAIKGKCIVCPHYATYNIPDNATNGDMVKAMFPYSQYGTIGDEVHVFRVGGNGVLVFSLNWWNAPYKAESEDKGCR